MENDRIKITLHVAQRPYEIEIERNTEIYYREAEKKINESVTDFAKQWKYTDHQDLLAKILIDFAIRSIEMEERLNEFDEELLPKMEDLKKIADTIDLD